MANKWCLLNSLYFKKKIPLVCYFRHISFLISLKYFFKKVMFGVLDEFNIVSTSIYP